MCNEDENKTILEGEKMKIYFEDGKLVNIKQLPIAPDYVIDASDGVTACMDMLDRIYSTNRDAVVYTNSIIAFSNRYAWNEEIDMATASESALKECIPKGKLKKMKENWIPEIR